ncbi:hypothetical protein ANN_24135, partial [Periplaneta americana]
SKVITPKMALKPGPLLNRYRHFFLGLFAILVLSLAIVVTVHYLPSGVYEGHEKIYQHISLDNLDRIPEVVIATDAPLSEGRNPHCSYYDCFNVYRCGHRGSNKILVYVYPLRKYVDERDIPVGSQMSREFYFILQTILESRYYTPNPEEACILVPSIDTLNQNRFRVMETSEALASLPYWKDGENHLIFNMVPGAVPDYSTVVELALGHAIIAGAGFSSWTYRLGFDISLPVYSPVVTQLTQDVQYRLQRPWLVVSSQINLHPEYERELWHLAQDHSELLHLEACTGDRQGNYSVRCRGKEVFRYPHVLQASFCGVMPLGLAAIFVSEDDLGSLMEILTSVSDDRIVELQRQGSWFYTQYLSSLKAITLTTLDILNDRVFPQNARTYQDWNMPSDPFDDIDEYRISEMVARRMKYSEKVCHNIVFVDTNSVVPRQKMTTKSPLFLQVTAPRSQGFTAVVLTYDRVESLFTLIQKLVKAPSLNKVLVVWNNQRKAPPHPSMWPKINKPLKVIQTKENKLSNRFYPYEEIETEAILTIDDDIVMLTADELEFGYEVWREFPDRIVGFPSRTHVWDNTTQRWKYESEWTNQISMVLTGAAFHHKVNIIQRT